MGKYKDIDYGTVNKYFYYDETSPSFLRWKVTRGNKKAGDIAGCINNNGYYTVGYDYGVYSVHRIIWVLFHGEIDSALLVDHIDNNRLNNNIKNLRLVDHMQNNNNRVNSKRDNDLPRFIYRSSNGKRDSNGRDYLLAQIRIPNSKRRISKSGYDLPTLLDWVIKKCAEHGIQYNI